MNRSALFGSILNHHLAVLGKTGAGKTSTEKLLIEQVVDNGARVCILDTIKSDWWGITSSADGKRPGLPFKILGGPRGHVPLHSSAGKAIGQLVGDGKLPLSIIDMADFEAGGIQRFFVDFAQSLWKNMRGVIYLVVEEAHEIAPKERAGFGAENMAIHWAKKIATGGRSKGIRLIVATQSVQQLHNRVLGSCETLIAHRLTTPADQEPVIKWMKANADKATQEQVDSSLSSLPTGTAWICSGEARIFQKQAFPKFRTYDNSATPTGDIEDLDVTTAAVDHDELKAIIGDAVAEAEANDPKALKAEIARLKGEAAKRPAAAPASPVVDVQRERFEADAIGFARGIEQATAKFRSWSKETGTRLVTAFEAVERARQSALDANVFTDAFEDVAKDLQSGSPTPVLPRRDGPVRVEEQAPKHAPSLVARGDGTNLTGPQQRMLDVIAFWNSVGYHAPTREQIAAVCGYSIKASTLRVVAGALKTADYIDYPDSGKIMLTPKGHAIARPLSADESKRKLESVLTGAQLRVVNILRDAGGKLTRSDLIGRAGYSEQASTHRVVIGGLKTLEVVDYPERSVVELSRWAAEVLAA